MLTITIQSFSYLRSGIPEDFSGNGGGFVFDCRFIDNPGRNPSFMQLCGKDKEVCDFLDSNDDMRKFLESVYSLIDPAIKNYIARDFTGLMISFGCTGGQHRSVYAVEKTAYHLKEKFGNKIKININHLELAKVG